MEEFMKNLSGLFLDLRGQLAPNIRAGPSEPLAIPKYDPEEGDLEEWVAEIEKLVTEFGWTEGETTVRAASSLIGSARRWYEKWHPEERNWAAFKTDLLMAFPRKRSFGKKLFDAATFNSQMCNSYGDYVREKFEKVRILRANWPVEKVLDIIIHGISDPVVRSTVLNSNCKDVAELSSVLSNFNMLNRTPTSNEHRRFPKRKRLSNEMQSNDKNWKRCYRCNRFGHLMTNCTLSDKDWGKRRHLTDNRRQFVSPRQNGPETGEPTSPAFVPSSGTNGAVCSLCFRPGHGPERCWMKAKVDRYTSLNKNVNLCTSPKSLVFSAAVIRGESVMCLLDSGADCSLLSENVANKISCHKVPAYNVLKGIGMATMTSSWKTTLVTEFEEVTVELDYFIVPKSYLNCDAIVGRNIFLNSDLAFVTDEFGTKIVRKGNCSVLEGPDWTTTLITDLEGVVRQQLISILGEYKEMLDGGISANPVSTGSLSIRLKEDRIISYNPYRLAPLERAKVQEIVKGLLARGIIQESRSPFASPILLVKKKNGEDRMCVDFRALNRITVKDKYPLPLIDDQIDSLAKSKFYSSLDMASGFHQIPIEADSVEKTGFVTPDGHYEYLRMPFGLANAPAVFQRAINTALGPLKGTIALVYLDDILIPSSSIEVGLQALKSVLDSLRRAGFSLNFAKCKFLVKRIEYLGREISGEGIRPSPSKVQVLLDSPKPKNVKMVRQFMGLASYFRRFIPDFAARTACITELTKKDQSWEWNEKHDTARDYVLGILTSRPLLAIYDPSLPTELHTDASSVGYGAILFQKHGETNRVVAYYSRRTLEYETRYHSYELETLAIFSALKHFRPYLLGIRFVIFTDCNAIKATANKRDLLPRVARWWVYFQDFDFEIQYRKGCAVPHVDFLSRNPPPTNLINNIRHQTWAEIEQAADKETSALIEASEKGELDPKQYCVKNNLLYHIEHINGEEVFQWYVPKGSRIGLLRLFHDEYCHIGAEKTFEAISKYFWFPRLRNFVSKYVSHCLKCKLYKARVGPKEGFLHSIEKVAIPFHTVHLDCMGPLPTTKEGFRHLLILVDSFTKFCMLYPLIDLTSAATVGRVKDFISIFGAPHRIIADSGTNFRSHHLTELCSSWCIELHFITPGVPRGNGQVERYVRTISNFLRVEVELKSEWASVLWKLQLTLNSTRQKSTGFSPLRLLLGIEGTLPSVRGILTATQPLIVTTTDKDRDRAAAERSLAANASKQKQSFDEKRRDSTAINVGTYVLAFNDTRRKPRLDTHYAGPYKVTEVLTGDRFKVTKVGESSRDYVFAKEQIRIWPNEWFPDDLEILFDSAEECENSEA